MLGVHTMVGVQVERGPQGASWPTVHAVTAGTDVGAPMQAPPSGTPGVEKVVGVQVLPVGQGASLPTVQGIRGGSVGTPMQAPPSGTPGVE